MKRILICGALFLGGCSAAGKPAPVDWPALIQDAAPSFESGKCGPALVWTKEIAVYDSAIVEGKLTIRRQCAEPSK